MSAGLVNCRRQRLTAAQPVPCTQEPSQQCCRHRGRQANVTNYAQMQRAKPPAHRPPMSHDASTTGERVLRLGCSTHCAASKAPELQTKGSHIRSAEPTAPRKRGAPRRPQNEQTRNTWEGANQSGAGGEFNFGP